MAGKGLIAFIVLCFTLALAAPIVAGDENIHAPVEAVAPVEARTIVESQAKADQRLFTSDGTSITVGTETLALGVLLLGILALAAVILPGLLGGGDEATAPTSYAVPSTYAVDPYAARSARSARITRDLDESAKKYE